ncbi:transposase, Ptta/En/Spm, plant [Spatholobus suberectus]|nr:transposase, Ptta/En/Spm, plant [Spatholobus suberectus]
MWKITHKRKDGSYVNDEAMEIGNKIDEYLSQNPKDASIISPNDVIGVIFGKEHPGYVRSLGMGVCPTIAFKHTTTQLNGMNLGSSIANTSHLEEKFVNMETKVATVKSQMQTLLAYIALKEGGNIPEEIASLFPTSMHQASLGRLKDCELLLYNVDLVEFTRDRITLKVYLETKLTIKSKGLWKTIQAKFLIIDSQQQPEDKIFNQSPTIDQ